MDFNPRLAADLFFCTEVPVVNKPRTACLYVAQISEAKGSENLAGLFTQSSFFLPG